MTVVPIQLDPASRPPFSRLWMELITADDRIFSAANKTALNHLVIKLSIAGFAIHLALIFLARSLPHPPVLIAHLGRNYLTAISTPFSFILFYEVLIFIRNVFKDIAAASSNLVDGHRLTKEAMPVFLDMWAALLMFLLVTIFQYVALQRVRPPGTEDRTQGLELFITQKKVVAVGLATLLLAMAAYNLVLFLLNIYRVLRTAQSNIVELPLTFYSDLFTVMIFTDVLILIFVGGRLRSVRDGLSQRRIRRLNHPDSLLNDRGTSLQRDPGLARHGLWHWHSSGIQLPQSHSERDPNRLDNFCHPTGYAQFSLTVAHWPVTHFTECSST